MTRPRARVLIVEDDRELAHVVRRNLEAEGYEVVLGAIGSDGLQLARDESIDLIILDVMLPVIDGFDVLESIRRYRPRVPVLMLTARRHVDDKVLAFTLGADDYLTKPFGIRELTARVAALLRRAATGPSDAPQAPVVLREARSKSTSAVVA